MSFQKISEVMASVSHVENMMMDFCTSWQIVARRQSMVMFRLGRLSSRQSSTIREWKIDWELQKCGIMAPLICQRSRIFPPKPDSERNVAISVCNFNLVSPASCAHLRTKLLRDQCGPMCRMLVRRDRLPEPGNSILLKENQRFPGGSRFSSC